MYTNERYINIDKFMRTKVLFYILYFFSSFFFVRNGVSTVHLFSVSLIYPLRKYRYYLYTSVIFATCLHICIKSNSDLYPVSLIIVRIRSPSKRKTKIHNISCKLHSRIYHYQQNCFNKIYYSCKE